MDDVSGHGNSVFWLLFIVLVLFAVFGVIFNLFLIDILIGLVVVLIGIQKLIEERHKNEMERKQNSANDTLKHISQWLDASHEFMSTMKNTHEGKLSELEKKKTDVDETIENNYRDVVKKVIELENKFNELTMRYARGEKLRSGRGKG
jgi:ABC-type transport system involved in cytochrome bd biosynthesis fused ATPase/permease subunit